MNNQLALFELRLGETKSDAVWEQLTSKRREVAIELLAELMARSLVDSGKGNEVGAREQDGE
jgi:hypothetical protein